MSNNRWQQGSLYQAHGAWHVRYDHSKIVDAIPTRVQRSKHLCDEGTPKKRVDQLFAEFMAEINIKLPPINRTQTSRWLNFGMMSTTHSCCKTSNLPRHKATFNLESTPQTALRRKLAARVSHPDDECVLTSLAKKYRPRTINHIKWLASATFAHAINIGACETNPIAMRRCLARPCPMG